MSSKPGAMRWAVYGILYCSYMLYYFNKKNYGYFLKNLMTETGASRAEIGALASAMELAGFVTSLVNGVLVDKYSPVLILAGMLVVASVTNALLCLTDSVPIMTVLWGINGFAQAFGWPCMAKIFMNWFPDPAERGKLYSVLSTCQNVGTALVPIMLLPLMNEAEANAAEWGLGRFGGWRVAMSFPAVCGLAYAAVLVAFVPSSPDGNTHRTRAKTTKVNPELHKSTVGSVFGTVASSPVVWTLSICYLGIGIVRDFYSNWGPNFIEESYDGTGLGKEEVQNIVKQAVSWQQVGGIVGTVIAGFLTDTLFDGRRAPVISILTIMICPISLFALYAPQEIVLAVPYCTFFLLGCCFTTPHVLIGLAARELVEPHLASTAGGFVSAMSKLGSAAAGAPVGRLMDSYGLDGALALLSGCGLLGGLSTLTLWNARPPEKRDPKTE